MAEMVPELLSKDDIVYPHEHQRILSDEPHFRRVWQFYREHIFKLRFCNLVEAGDITQEEANAFKSFIDLQNVPTFNLYIYGRLGQLPHLEQDAGYQATVKVMEKLGLGLVELDRLTSMPYEQQFWEQFDIIMNLSEEEMRRDLPYFVTDPSN
jgi:hypothetical protein